MGEPAVGSWDWAWEQVDAEPWSDVGIRRRGWPPDVRVVRVAVRWACYALRHPHQGGLYGAWLSHADTRPYAQPCGDSEVVEGLEVDYRALDWELAAANDSVYPPHNPADPRSFACPFCGAGIGDRCVTHRGRGDYVSYTHPHIKRRQLTEDPDGNR